MGAKSAGNTKSRAPAKKTKKQGQNRKAKPGMNPQPPSAEAVYARHVIARFANSLLKKVVLAQTAVIVVLSLATWYAASQPVQTKVIGLTDSLRVVQLQPLSEPNISNASLIQWASNAIPNSYSFDYVNYRKQLQDAGNRFFTKSGFVDYVHEMQNSQTLSLVKKNEYIMSSVVSGAPTIIAQGQTKSGVYAWKVQAPIVVTMENKDERRVSKRRAEIVIIRSREMSGKKGVAISRFVVTKTDR